MREFSQMGHLEFMKQRLIVSPHPGIPLFLWGGPPLSRGGRAGFVETERIGISSDLVRDFEAWQSAWEGNFQDRIINKKGMIVPFWKEGFDSIKWRSHGVALMHRLQDERPDLDVRNGFDMYVYPTDPVTHEPQTDY